MKTLFSLALLALPLEALACRPMAHETCATPLVKLHQAEWENLSKSVSAFQKILSASAARIPHKGSSCFNNSFASFFLRHAKEFSERHDGQVCPAELKQIEENARELINPGSAEWKALAADGEKFKAAAPAVEKALKAFSEAHR